MIASENYTEMIYRRLPHEQRSTIMDRYVLIKIELVYMDYDNRPPNMNWLPQGEFQDAENAYSFWLGKQEYDRRDHWGIVTPHCVVLDMETFEIAFLGYKLRRYASNPNGLGLLMKIVLKDKEYIKDDEITEAGQWQIELAEKQAYQYDG